MAFNINVCFVLTVMLLSFFIHYLISSSVELHHRNIRLRENVQGLAVYMKDPKGEFGVPRQLNGIIDAILKKRLAGIWDDLYTVKKQLRGKQCAELSAMKGQNAIGSIEDEPQRANFASEELGARIELVKAEPVASTDCIKKFFGMEFRTNAPVEMIRAQMSPGACFAFKNNISDVTIRLSHVIRINEFEITHITSNMSPTAETSSAPKDFTVYGILGHQKKHLGNFSFDNKQRRQRYPIKDDGKYGHVHIHFETNHGNPNYTCVYRFAVYGRIGSASVSDTGSS